MSLASSLATTDRKVANKTSKVTNNGSKKPGKLGGMIDSVSGIQKNVAGTVVGVGNIVAKVAGGALGKFLNGKTKINYKNKKLWTNEAQQMGGLAGFYSKFGDTSSLEGVDRIDPFSTFECTFRFYPNVVGTRPITCIRKSLIKTTNTSYIQDGEVVSTDSSSSEVKLKMEKKLGEISTDSVIGKMFQFVNYKNIFHGRATYNGGETKMEDVDNTDSLIWLDENQGERTEEKIQLQLITENYIQNVQMDLNIELGIYIQKITVPSLVIDGGEDSTTLLGKFPIPGNLVVPDNNNFSMEIVNVQSPIPENIFYPWMRETTFPWWSYPSQPFTTAHITVDFTKDGHSNVKYHFFGCRPTSIQLIQPDQSANQNLTRNVQFTFDFMTVETVVPKATTFEAQKKQKATNSHGGDKNGSMANAALFSAANTLRL